MNCAKYIIKWCKSYNVEIGDITFEGYTEEFPKDIGGRCYYFILDGERKAQIKIPKKIRGKLCLCKVALWHEYCHAELFIKKGITGHSKWWYIKMIRKPHMFLGQLLLMHKWNKI